jgi:hypothetical protein
MKRFLYLLPVLIHRCTGWLPFQPKQGGVQFTNIGEGTADKGIKSYASDVISSAAGLATVIAKESLGKYLLWMAGSDADHVTPTTANTDVPIGVSDDSPPTVLSGSTRIGVKVLGAFPGTTRMVWDGVGTTPTNGMRLMPSSASYLNGTVTIHTTSGTNTCVGSCLVGLDQGTLAAGSVIEVVPCLPSKYLGT